MVRAPFLVLDRLKPRAMLMPMISYAQNAEDVLLNRLFPADYRGFYIDVGANHPVNHSVTKHFSLRGWTGINIEPSPIVFAELQADRTGDVNLNVGVSDREGTMPFFEAIDSLGMSTFSLEFAAGLRHDGYTLREREVPVTTLARICERHVGGPIDFLKVDAESHESEVLAGTDWTRWRPRVVLVEATGPQKWEPALLENGYLFAAFDGLNRYYVRDEDRAFLPLLAVPANVLDDFVSYEHLYRMGELRRESDELRSDRDRLLHEVEELRTRIEGIGPIAIATARRLRSGSIRFPRISRIVKRYLRAG